MALTPSDMNTATVMNVMTCIRPSISAVNLVRHIVRGWPPRPDALASGSVQAVECLAGSRRKTIASFPTIIISSKVNHAALRRKM
eukprot:g81273.t1